MSEETTFYQFDPKKHVIEKDAMIAIAQNEKGEFKAVPFVELIKSHNLRCHILAKAKEKAGGFTGIDSEDEFERTEFGPNDYVKLSDLEQIIKELVG